MLQVFLSWVAIEIQLSTLRNTLKKMRIKLSCFEIGKICRLIFSKIIPHLKKLSVLFSSFFITVLMSEFSFILQPSKVMLNGILNLTLHTIIDLEFTDLLLTTMKFVLDG